MTTAVWSLERDQIAVLTLLLTAASAVATVASALLQLTASATGLVVLVAATVGTASAMILGYRIWHIVPRIRPTPDHVAYLPKVSLLADCRQLVGRESVVTDILEALEDRDGTTAVCITGFPGAGKTAIATEVMNRLYERDDIGTLFVSAKRTALRDGFIYPLEGRLLDSAGLSRQLLEQWRDGQGAAMVEAIRLGRLKELFTGQRCVVLLDNVETLRDYERAVRAMIPLFGVSRLLITSRYPLAHIDNVREFEIGGLDRPAAFALVRLEADHRNVDWLSSAGDDKLESIYQRTNGIPLLIQWVLGQIIRARGFDAALADLGAPNNLAPGQNALYEFLFADAWEALSEDAQKVLVLIARTPHPVSFGVLERLLPPDPSGQPFDVLKARAELIERSLVEVEGPLEIHQQSYSVHPVTRSCIEHLSQKWQKQKESLVPSPA